MCQLPEASCRMWPRQEANEVENLSTGHGSEREAGGGNKIEALNCEKASNARGDGPSPASQVLRLRP